MPLAPITSSQACSKMRLWAPRCSALCPFGYQSTCQSWTSNLSIAIHGSVFDFCNADFVFLDTSGDQPNPLLGSFLCWLMGLLCGEARSLLRPRSAGRWSIACLSSQSLSLDEFIGLYITCMRRFSCYGRLLSFIRQRCRIFGGYSALSCWFCRFSARFQTQGPWFDAR